MQLINQFEIWDAHRFQLFGSMDVTDEGGSWCIKTAAKNAKVGNETGNMNRFGNTSPALDSNVSSCLKLEWPFQRHFPISSKEPRYWIWPSS